MPPPFGPTPIGEVFEAADTALTDLIDCIRKTPPFLEEREKREREVLDRLAPAGDAVGDLRRRDEARRYAGVYPALMASGNLFMALSLFEMHLFRLAKLLERESGVVFDNRKGYGVFGAIAYLDQLGLAPRQAELWPQVDAALKFRNCLLHAGGLIAYSREAGTLRQMVRDRIYLQERLRQGDDPPWAEVSLVASELGDRLEITNNYAFQAAKYLRTYLLGLCRAAVGRFPGTRRGT